MIAGEPLSANPFGQGHLHDTFLVTTEGEGDDYILQRINHKIFRNIEGMMENIAHVTHHLKDKLKNRPHHDPLRESLTLILTRSGDTYLKDAKGNYWRMYLFISGASEYQKIEDAHLAMEAGRIIGDFQLMLSDLDHTLCETLPRFHDIHFRLEQYREACENDRSGRLENLAMETAFVAERASRMTDYYESLRRDAVVRVTHNDTKVNNVLFNDHHKAMCLLDLDTVMPGYIHFDFGDAVRTMANTALEDEQDLKRVHFNMDLFKAFSKGYLSRALKFLTPEEMELIPYSPVYLTFLIGLRFLTDHINGDRYFKTKYPAHNLVRAHVQFRLVEEMEKMQKEMREILDPEF